MSDLLAYLVLGFRHIADPSAADHLLFLLVLGAVYRLQDWRAALLTVSAFTVGHSITLGIAVAGWLTPSSAWIEFLIPVTIVATGVENLWRGERVSHGRWPMVRPALALMFGLVHGLGFAGYLRALLGDEIGVPLLGFNLGVEMGQVMILAAAAVLFAGIDALIDRVRATAAVGFAWRLRSVSAVVTLVALVWAGERWP
ncbi:MAG: HupE/UreJ family protein [Gemmatimonadaceae bacterium]|nr:HupE/UreJ family protein [Gemmatimonadaceae bacterium]